MRFKTTTRFILVVTIIVKGAFVGGDGYDSFLYRRPVKIVLASLSVPRTRVWTVVTQSFVGPSLIRCIL
jgi:hypothetical protein